MVLRNVTVVMYIKRHPNVNTTLPPVTQYSASIYQRTLAYKLFYQIRTTKLSPILYT